jgi:hypothetical protein
MTDPSNQAWTPAAETFSAGDAAEQMAQGSTGLGVTEADIEGILSQLRDVQTRLDQAERERIKSAPPVLVSTVDSLLHHLEGHGDPDALDIGKSLQEAAVNSTQSGDTGPMVKIAAKLARHLQRNAPYPGENYHYKAAADWAANHVPDAIDAFVPPAASQAVTSDRAPVKVVEGTVVG